MRGVCSFVFACALGCSGPVDVDVVRVPVDDGDAYDDDAPLATALIEDRGSAAPAVAVDAAAIFLAAGLRADVAQDAGRAVQNAREQGLLEVPVFAVIDFSLPSTQRRLWTFDVDSGAVLFNDRVSHGSGSNSDADRAMAARFSDTPGSLMSSLGLSRGAETYEGQNGYSLRLDGLEDSNDNMRDRAIVVHGAAYAEDAFVDDNGYLGRSSGCPAVAMSRSAAFIDLVKEGALLLQWFPDEAWRSSSPFLR